MATKIKIVIADDHPLLREGLAQTLIKVDKFQLIGQASNGKEALNLIKEYRPDIAILDVQMPIIDGFEVAKTILSEKINTRIIFLTMFKEEAFVKKVIDLGIKGYVLKENALEDIVNCIEMVFEDKFFVSPQVSDVLFNGALIESKNNLLTPSESKILQLISEEKTSKEIAGELCISVKTVENHRSNICKKLRITGNSALLRYALTNKSRL